MFLEWINLGIRKCILDSSDERVSADVKRRKTATKRKYVLTSRAVNYIGQKIYFLRKLNEN